MADPKVYQVSQKSLAKIDNKLIAVFYRSLIHY